MKTPFALLATAALLITTGAAHADVLVSNASISYEAEVQPKPLDWLAPGKLLSLQQFNPLLGTLNSVSFSWSGQLDTSVRLKNLADDPNQISYTLTGSMSFGLPWAAAVLQEFAPSSDMATLAADEVATRSVLLEILGGHVVQGSLTNYIGVAAFDLWVTAEGSSTSSDEASNFAFMATPKASAWVQVTYDYTAAGNAVPEPGALSLLGLALAAAGIASRRRA